MVRLLSTLVLCLGLVAPLKATPRDELLRYVPDDYTFCIVVQNLRDHSKPEASPAFKNLLQSPLLQALASAPEAKNARDTLTTVLRDLDVTADQLRDDILGDAVVIAYRKGPPDKPDAEDGLILVHARDAKLLAKVMDRINAVQTKAGEVKSVEAVKTDVGTYMRRTKNNAAPADGYILADNVLLFATRDAALPTLLARQSNDPAKRVPPPLAKRLAALKLDDALAVGFINPRSFDADLQALGDAGAKNEQLFLKEFRHYWKALDGLTMFVRTTPTVEVGITLNVRTAELPPAAKQFFAEAGKRSPLWEIVPDDALFAAVGRFHLESFVSMFRLFLAPEEQAKIKTGLADAARAFWEGDDVAGILKGFGPDVGLCVAPPHADDKTWFPQAFLALKTGDGDLGKQAEEAALAGLDFLARSACLADKELRMHKEKQGDIVVKSLSHASKFPPGFRPAFAAKNGYLVVASAPSVVSRFAPPRTAATSTDEVPLVRFSATAWRAYMQKHRADLTNYLATLNGKDPTTMAAELDGFTSILAGFDKVELLQRSAPNQATLLLRLTAAK